MCDKNMSYSPDSGYRYGDWPNCINASDIVYCNPYGSNTSDLDE